MHENAVMLAISTIESATYATESLLWSHLHLAIIAERTVFNRRVYAISVATSHSGYRFLIGASLRPKGQCPFG